MNKCNFDRKKFLRRKKGSEIELSEKVLFLFLGGKNENQVLNRHVDPTRAVIKQTNNRLIEMFALFEII